MTGEDLPVAQAVLQPDRTPPVTMSSAVKCTLCGARDSRWQGWIFWSLLVVALVALIPVGLRLPHGVLLVAASGAALVLAGVDLSFKDYRCNRCGKHFRLQSRRRRAR